MPSDQSVNGGDNAVAPNQAGSDRRVPAQPLARFAAAMRLQGWHLAPARLAFDPIYARHWFALAHTSADDVLRRLAVELFEDQEALMMRTWPQSLLLRQTAFAVEQRG
jgi:hypothetical protein